MTTNNVSNIVHQTLNIQAGSGKGEDFGTPMVAIPHCDFLERAALYSELDSDLSTTNIIYRAQEAAFAQKINQMYVGRLRLDTILGTVPPGEYRTGKVFTMEIGPTEIRAITVVTAGIAKVGSITIAGDHAADLPDGEVITIKDATTNNGEHTVYDAIYGGANTVVRFYDAILASAPLTGNMVRDLASPYYQEGTYTTTGTTSAISALAAGVAGAGTFSIAADVEDDLDVGQTITVSGSTDNDGTYTVLSAIFGAATVITVAETVTGAIADGNIIRQDNERDIATGLKTALDLLLAEITITATLGVLDFTTDLATDNMIVRSPDWGNVAMSYTSAGLADGSGLEASVKAGLTAINAAFPGKFYGVTTYVDRSATEQEAAAEWLQTADGRHIYFYSSSDANIADQTETADTSTVAFELKDAGYKMCRGVYKSDSDGSDDDKFFDLGDLSRNLISDPALENTAMTFKKIVGMSPDVLISSQVVNISDKNCGFFWDIEGENRTGGGYQNSVRAGGVDSTGIPMHIWRGSHYMMRQIEVALYNLLAANADGNTILGFNGPGLEDVRAAIERVLDGRVAVGFLDYDQDIDEIKGYRLTLPEISTISSADQIAGLLRGIKIVCSAVRDIQRFQLTINVI